MHAYVAVRLLVENYMKRCVILGTTIRIERVSSEVIILRPPEKLIIEVRVSGEYEVIFWRKGTTSTFIPGQMRPQEFSNYFETFVRGNTTAGDEGVYIAHPQFKSGTTQTHTFIPTCCVDFGVIAPGKFNIYNIVRRELKGKEITNSSNTSIRGINNYFREIIILF